MPNRSDTSRVSARASPTLGGRREASPVFALESSSDVDYYLPPVPVLQAPPPSPGAPSAAKMRGRTPPDVPLAPASASEDTMASGMTIDGGVARQLSNTVIPLLAGLLQHPQASVRDTGQRILDSVAMLRDHTMATGGSLPTTPGDAMGMGGGAVAGAKAQGSNRQGQERKRLTNVHRPPSIPPNEPRRVRTASEYAAQAARRASTSSSSRGSSHQPPVSPQLRTALGPSPTEADGLRALANALDVIGVDVLPLHSILPILSSTLESPDPAIQSSARTLANSLRRLHGDEAIFAPLTSPAGVGSQLLSSLRRDSPSATRAPTGHSTASISEATSSLSAAVLAFGPSVIDLPYLMQHNEASVREAAGSLAGLAAGTGRAVHFGGGNGGLQDNAGECMDALVVGSSCANQLTKDRKSTRVGKRGFSPPSSSARDGVRTAPNTPAVRLESGSNLPSMPRNATNNADSSDNLNSFDRDCAAPTELQQRTSPHAQHNTGNDRRLTHSLELNGSGLRGHEPIRGRQPIPRFPVHPPPEDLSWKTEKPALTVTEAEMVAGSEVPSHVEYVQLSSRGQRELLSPEWRQPLLPLSPARSVGATTPTMLQPPFADSVPAMLQLARPITTDSMPAQHIMRSSLSTGSLPMHAAQHMGAAIPGETGACDYLQKLPPMLRRSVCGTGARQHTRAIYSGER